MAFEVYDRKRIIQPYGDQPTCWFTPVNRLYVNLAAFALLAEGQNEIRVHLLYDPEERRVGIRRTAVSDLTGWMLSPVTQLRKDGRRAIYGHSISVTTFRRHCGIPEKTRQTPATMEDGMLTFRAEEKEA